MFSALREDRILPSEKDQLQERRKEILLVDDSPAAARLIIESLKESLGQCRVTIRENGEEALALLRYFRKSATAAQPDLILLDLNLPTMSGHEILAILKADPVLRRIPVMILTTSQAEEDKALSYTLGAEHFLVKPSTWSGYQTISETIAAFFTRDHPSVLESLNHAHLGN